MNLPTRRAVVRVRSDILTIYKNKNGSLAPLAGLRGGYLVPRAAEALARLHDVVAADGGTLRVSDCFRSVADQAAARAKYERWLAAGKPRTAAAGLDATMKTAFCARPGRSFHCAGRAVDLDHMGAAPPSVPKAQRLDWLWARAIPLGWRPVIKEADEGAKEAWHFDFMGPWLPVYERIGYEAAAICAVLDLGIGADVFDRADERWIQAQLQRVGQDVGDVDGYIGRKTRVALGALGLDGLLDSEVHAALAAMPSAAR